MPKRIFIGSLSVQTTEEDLRDLCRKLPDVSSTSLERDEDGSLRAVVEFTDDGACEAATEKLQKASLYGRALNVTAAG